MQALKAGKAVVKGPGKGFTIPLTAAQRALALPFKKLNFEKDWLDRDKKTSRLISEKTSARRNTGGRVEQAAQRTGNEGARMRQALVARRQNGASRRKRRTLFCRKAELATAAASFSGKKRYSGQRGPGRAIP